jgi:hypothetical protein
MTKKYDDTHTKIAHEAPAEDMARSFLEHVYGAVGAPDVWTCGFGHFPGNWTGGRGAGALRGLKAGGANLFFCIGEIGQGEVRRSNSGVVRQHLLIVDDIGTKVDPALWDGLFAMGMPAPCYRIETSVEPSGVEGDPLVSNQTWLWKLDVPIGVDDLEDWEGLALIRAHLADRDLTDNVMDEARYVRLPMGWNSKHKYAGGGRDGGWPAVRMVGGEAQAAFEGGAGWGGVSLEDLGVGLLGSGWRDLDMPVGAVTSAGLAAGVGGALVRTADMNDPEPVIQLAMELGLLPEQVRGGVVQALCPNIAEHGDRPETGFAFLGNGLCQCQHASCQGLRSSDFRTMMIEQYNAARATATSAGLTLTGASSGEGFLAAADFLSRGGVGDATDVATANAMAERMGASASAREATGEQAMSDLAERFIWLAPLDIFFDTLTRKPVTRGGFDTHPAVLPHIKVGASGTQRACHVLMNRPDVRFAEGMVYMPGENLAIVDAPDENGMLVAHINTWVPSGVREVAGVPARWLELVGYVIPDRDYREWLLDFLAWIIQNPAARLPLIPLIIGGQGIGKDMLLDPVRAVIGQHNSVGVDAAMMEGAFNEWMRHRLAVSSELKLPKDGRLYNRIKEWTGMGNARLTINAKFQRPYNIESRLVFFAFSNHVDSLKGLEPDDRRWVIYISLAEKNTAAYYAAMGRDLGSVSEIGRVAHFLATRDISAFDPFTPPDVAGMHRQAALVANLAAPAEWVHEAVTTGRFAARKWLSIGEVLRAAQTTRDPLVSRAISAKAVSDGMAAAGCETFRRVRIGSNDRASLWFGVDMPEAERRIAARLTGKEAGSAYEAERDAHVAALQSRLLGSQN